MPVKTIDAFVAIFTPPSTKFHFTQALAKVAATYRTILKREFFYISVQLIEKNLGFKSEITHIRAQ